MTWSWRAALLASIVATASGLPVRASPASDALRARASDELYNLDDERSITTWREAVTTDAQDSAAWRGLGSAILAHISMLRGTMTVDSYLGRVGTRDIALPAPPAALATEFNTAIARAISLARLKTATHPNDVQAHYELGAAVGIRATYLATVDGGVIAAFGAAQEAYDEHERVLQLDPSRADAALTVGTYRYLISTMPMPKRWFAYMAGFGGGRDRGIGQVETAAAYSGDNQAEARIALLLLYTREARYDSALQQLAWLRQRYPRNRLLWLETASTLIRATRPAEAERVLDDGIRMLERDKRPRMYGEEALWFYRRGSARAAVGRASDAVVNLNRSIAADGRKWVQGRAHLELGRLALGQRNADAARTHLQAAIQLGESDRDQMSAAQARELLRQGATPR